MNINFTPIMKYIPFILGGIIITLQVAVTGALFGSILGLLFGLSSRKKGIAGRAVKLFVDFFRGTPIVFQLMFFHYGLPQITGWNPTVFTTAAIIFSLNSSAYLAEILRAGIESIDKGQIEAAVALGVKKSDISLHIIIPQAIRNVLPAIMNEFITLTKETSVISMIGGSDLVRRQSIVSGTTYHFFEPLIIVGVVYFLLNIVLSTIGKQIERKLNYD